MQTKITFAGGDDRPRHVQPREHAPVVGRQRLGGELQPHLLQGRAGDARRVPVRRPQRTDRRGRAGYPGGRRGVRGQPDQHVRRRLRRRHRRGLWTGAPSNPRPYTLFSGATTYFRPGIAYIALRRILGPANFAAALQQHAAQPTGRGASPSRSSRRASARSCRAARVRARAELSQLLHAVVRHRLPARRRREQAADHRARARRRRIHLPPVNYWGASHTAMTAYWTAAAAITRVWKSSWYPNTAGAGSGRLTA